MRNYHETNRLRPQDVFGKPLGRNEDGKPVPRMYADGGGLYLAVRPSTRRGVTDPDKDALRYWVFRYMINGKSYALNLGKTPYSTKIGSKEVKRGLSLRDARIEAAAMLEKVEAGINPKDERMKEKEKTFGQVAEEYIRLTAPTWTNPKTEPDWKAALLDPKSPKGIAADLMENE